MHSVEADETLHFASDWITAVAIVLWKIQWRDRENAEIKLHVCFWRKDAHKVFHFSKCYFRRIKKKCFFTLIDVSIPFERKQNSLTKNEINVECHRENEVKKNKLVEFLFCLINGNLFIPKWPNDLQFQIDRNRCSRKGIERKREKMLAIRSSIALHRQTHKSNAENENQIRNRNVQFKWRKSFVFVRFRCNCNNVKTGRPKNNGKTRIGYCCLATHGDSLSRFALTQTDDLNEPFAERVNIKR